MRAKALEYAKLMQTCQQMDGPNDKKNQRKREREKKTKRKRNGEKDCFISSFFRAVVVLYLM